VIAVAGTLGSLVQWRRLRWPAIAAVVGSAAYLLSGNPGPWLVGVYSGASYSPRRRVWLVALAGWVGFEGLSWLVAGRLSATDIAWSAVATGLVVAVGLYTAAPASRARCTTCWPTRCRSSRCTPARWNSPPTALRRTRPG
jgi:hypothetical protein